MAATTCYTPLKQYLTLWKTVHIKKLFELYRFKSFTCTFLRKEIFTFRVDKQSLYSPFLANSAYFHRTNIAVPILHIFRNVHA